MHLDDAESELLKTWIVHKLETISDADSDVLADYVLALVKTDEPEPLSRANCAVNLEDFLGNNTATFVNDVYAAIHTKVYDPSRPLPKPVAPVYQPGRLSGHGLSTRPRNESRKRRHHDWDGVTAQSREPISYGDERPLKQSRRGGGETYSSLGGRSAYRSLSWQPPRTQIMPNVPSLPSSIPPFDPNNPLPALMAMHQAMGLIMPNFGAQSKEAGPRAPSRSAQRCNDYDNKGFCTRGLSCPYEHGEHPFVLPTSSEAYDPNNAGLFDIGPRRSVPHARLPKSAVRGGAFSRGRGGSRRAQFSLVGQNHDRNLTSIVVENIPTEHFDEDSIRAFFVQFGQTIQVRMQPYRRLAVVRFDSYDSARAAYESPKVVFDNRFVKVYWYKPGTLLEPAIAPSGEDALSKTKHKPQNDNEHGDVDMDRATDEIDIEEVTRQQDGAQHKYEAAKRRREEVEKQKADLAEKLMAIEQERHEVNRLLAKKTGLQFVSEPQESKQTKALKAQLASLEAEAESLGIDPNTDNVSNGYGSYSASHRGRGGFRGRPRGRGGYPGSFRGGYGAFAVSTGAVMRLDNRPKTVRVGFLDGSYDAHEEALRSYFLLGDMEHVKLRKHPERQDAALISFQERYQGEIFMGAILAGSVPHVGKVELSWHAGDVSRQPVANGHHVKGAESNGTNGRWPKTNPEEDLAPSVSTPEDDDLDRW